MSGENGCGIWEGGAVGRVGVVKIMGGENGGGMQPLHILNRGIAVSKPYKPSFNSKNFNLRTYWMSIPS